MNWRQCFGIFESNFLELLGLHISRILFDIFSLESMLSGDTVSDKGQ